MKNSQNNWEENPIYGKYPDKHTVILVQRKFLIISISQFPQNSSMHAHVT